MSNLMTIQKTFYKVADFISWKKKSGLVLSPKFQRRSVWNKGAKSFLIDTIYRGLPIPIIFLRDRGIDKVSYEPIREVIDGQQRLRTVISFIAPELLEDFNSDQDEFVVQKTHNKDLAGKKFNDLSQEMKDRILNYEFNVHIISANMDDRDIIQIFRRMNSINYILKKQELINANYYGEFKTSQYDLAAEHLEMWRKWKTFTEQDIARMNEVELTSELTISIIEKKIHGKSFPLIESYYKRLDAKYPNRKIVESRFRNTLDFISKNFSGNKNDFVFYKKTIFYAFFMAVYDMLYNMKKPIDSVVPKKITPSLINNLKQKGDKIFNKTAPTAVLAATERRTTSIGERTILFNYLKA